MGYYQWQRTTDKCHNVDETQKHYTEWEMPDTKGHTLYGSIYKKLQNRQNWFMVGKKNENRNALGSGV